MMKMNIRKIRKIDNTEQRIEFLKKFDYYIKDTIGDDEITDEWLMLGLPDEYNEKDLEDIALDDDLWLSCVECFKNCCKNAGVI